jgi:TRAP-type C4-dicarboxylate transport system permease small subunit
MLPNLTAYAQVREWGDCVVDGVPTLKCLEVVLSNLLTMASALIAFVLFIMFIVGGFNYLTSFGNAEKIKKAKGTITYAVAGVILFVSAFLILRIIDWLFLGNQGLIFRFELP